ncbi:hypothetical protein K438DRAFT_1975965 [Mycena galopus ATCC 62051]|nr:hypothetical protein K438DRAFT_1975965 [Mycena galopus ATCC 62051]
MRFSRAVGDHGRTDAPSTGERTRLDESKSLGDAFIPPALRVATGGTDGPRRNDAAWSMRAGVDVKSGSNDETRSDDATDGEDVHGPHHYHYRVLGRRHTDAGYRVYIYRPDDNTTPTPVHAPTGEGPPAFQTARSPRFAGEGI